jgi:hypothetical protein
MGPAPICIHIGLPGEPDTKIAPAALYFCYQFFIHRAVAEPVTVDDELFGKVEGEMSGKVMTGESLIVNGE